MLPSPASPVNDPADDYHQQRLADGRACLEAARDGLRRGWSVLAICPPDHCGMGKWHKCDSPGKRPWHEWKEFQEKPPTEQQVQEWWRRQPTSNYGLALGPASKLIRVDADGPSGVEKLLQLSGGHLPPTPEFDSGRDNGGLGLLYRIPAGVVLRTTYDSHKKKEELRLQAKGAQTVLPPSRHVSGSLYRWKLGRAPWEVEVAVAPDWAVAQLLADNGRSTARSPKKARVLAEGEVLHEGERDDVLTSLGGSMRRRGFCREAIEAALLVENELRCEPPLPDDQVKKIAASLGRYLPAEVPGPARAGHHAPRVMTFTLDVEA